MMFITDLGHEFHEIASVALLVMSFILISQCSHYGGEPVLLFNDDEVLCLQKCVYFQYFLWEEGACWALAWILALLCHLH